MVGSGQIRFEPADVKIRHVQEFKFLEFALTNCKDSQQICDVNIFTHMSTNAHWQKMTKLARYLYFIGLLLLL